jgi:RNA polymerase sigma-70 factor (ECF subfamily)
VNPDLDELTQAAAGGDHAALERLLEHHLPALRAYIRLRAGSIVRQRESCSDLVQSVCREVLQHADRFQHPSESAFRRWLFTTALRKIIDRRNYHISDKREPAREQRPEDIGAHQALLEAYSSFCTPSHDIEAKEEYLRIEGAMDSLSEEQREVVTMAHLAGLSRAEIAEHMGKSEGAVRTILYRALARLAVVLGSNKEPE